MIAAAQRLSHNYMTSNSLQLRLPSPGSTTSPSAYKSARRWVSDSS